MEHAAAREAIANEDRKVGIAIGAIGVAISAFMAALVAGLTLYHGAFYGA